LCLTAILTNSNHQHNGMEGAKHQNKLPYAFHVRSFIYFGNKVVAKQKFRYWLSKQNERLETFF
jgi:hypothetical protein